MNLSCPCCGVTNTYIISLHEDWTSKKKKKKKRGFSSVTYLCLKRCLSLFSWGSSMTLKAARVWSWSRDTLNTDAFWLMPPISVLCVQLSAAGVCREGTSSCLADACFCAWIKSHQSDLSVLCRSLRIPQTHRTELQTVLTVCGRGLLRTDRDQHTWQFACL
jgi:hypothetical protein